MNSIGLSICTWSQHFYYCYIFHFGDSHPAQLSSIREYCPSIHNIQSTTAIGSSWILHLPPGILPIEIPPICFGCEWLIAQDIKFSPIHS